MSSQPESLAPVVSLRGHRARILFRRYSALPSELRTPARTRLVLEAIMDYAFEDQGSALAPDADADVRVYRRLQEFLPVSEGSWPGGVMGWLHENLVPGAIRQRQHLAEFVGDCLRGA